MYLLPFKFSRKLFSIICVTNLVFLHVCMFPGTFITNISYMKCLFSQRECSSLIRIEIRLTVLYHNYKWLGDPLRPTDSRRKKGCDAREARAAAVHKVTKSWAQLDTNNDPGRKRDVMPHREKKKKKKNQRRSLLSSKII